MDKHLVLSELLLVLDSIKNEKDGGGTPIPQIDSLWTAIKEISGIKADGLFSNHLLNYVLEMMDNPKRKLSDDDPYGNIIEYLTNSTIVVHENF